MLTLPTLCYAPTIMLTATVNIAVKDVTTLATDGVCSYVTIVTLTLTVERKIPLFT
jgi:hypothetical protein